MPLQKLQFRPGINKESTSFANEGGWVDCDKVRFRQGYPEKINGWEIKTSGFVGACRALKSWQSLSLERYTGLGTHLKYFIEEGSIFYDITPIRNTTSAGDVTFSASSGSSTITITDTNHGAREGDFVTFSGATSLGGAITANVLNQEYVVASVTNTSTYTIKARTADTPLSDYYSNGSIDTSGAEVDATASDTGNGGSSTVGEYQINSGLDTSVFGDGWGAGTWSRGTWNSAADLEILIETLRLWQHDTFGEDLIMNIRNGGIYYWDASVGTSTRAVALEDLVGASNAPTVANKVLVSDIDRHVIAFGANPLGSSTQDPLLIRFSDQENAADWTPTTTNTAGDLRLGTGSEIITAVETRQQILIFTDQSMHTMQFLGPPYTFGVNMVAENITIRSPNAAVSVEDSVFWMGTSEFMVYRGTVQNLNCTLKEYVFDDLNLDQAEKVFAAANTGYGEVWWFYPSGTSLNVDKYVVYNYEQDIWYHGSLDRSSWIDSGLADYPLATDNQGSIYFHEFGIDGDGEAIEAHVESSPIDIGEGDQFSYATSILPDISFRNSSTSGLPHSVTFNIKGYNYNGGTTLSGQDDNHVVSTSDVSLERFDGKKDIRVRGRSLSLKVSSDSVGTTWRLGIPRINIRTDGKR
jgi:hypothetical protein